MYPVGTVLSIPSGFYKHVGTYIGGNLMLHNHSERGEEVVTIQQFAEGNAVSVDQFGVADQMAFGQRVRKVLANPQRYNPFFRNCDHTVTEVRTGIASSPQLAAIVFLALFVGSVVVLAKAR